MNGNWYIQQKKGMKDLKYLAAYINPMLTNMGLLLGWGIAWAVEIFSFVMIPILY